MTGMDRIVFQVEQDTRDGGYVAEAFVTEEEHLVTQGDTVDELKEMIRDALACHFDDAESFDFDLNPQELENQLFK